MNTLDALTDVLLDLGVRDECTHMRPVVPAEHRHADCLIRPKAQRQAERLAAALAKAGLRVESISWDGLTRANT